MKRPALFFDRDNTLIINDGYLGDPAGVRLMDGAADAIALARQLGFVVVTVSNQSGVARGLFGEDAVHAVNAAMDALLQAANPMAIIDRHEFCPFHPQAVVASYRLDSDLRKPKPGLLLRAAAALNLDLSQSWLIGDAPRDIEAGKAAGCRTILFQPRQIPASAAAGGLGNIVPDATASSLGEAMQIIRHFAAK
jgi:D-glycero-D-manno-heptose 1,7-bisphosphate phosphatase